MATNPKSVTINQLRLYVEETDRKLMELLDRRYRLSTRIGSLKSEAGEKVYDQEREQLLVDQAVSYSEDMPDKLASELYTSILTRIRLESEKENG